MDIGKQIKNLRIEKGITQEELANVLNVSYQAVSKWENGVTMPDIQQLPTIAVYFGITIDELFKLTNESQLERISNMIENEKIISEEKFRYTKGILESMLKEKYNAGDVYCLLSELYNHRSREDREIAEDYAKKALEINPKDKGYHLSLVKAMNGSFGDFYCNRHDDLINYYKKFIEKNNDGRICFVFLFDQLMADRRFEEAKLVLEKMKSFGTHIENTAFEGDIEFGLGNLEKAVELWNKNVEDNKENWMAYFIRGERFVSIGRYEDALDDYRKCMELQEKPRIVDPLTTMAKVYEILGEKDKAIEANKEKIKVLKEEWKLVSGEQIDEPEREILRLKQ